jgi:hypothetical protein
MAARAGSSAALLVAAVGLAAGAFAARRHSLHGLSDLDLEPSLHWAPPVTAGHVEHDRGPVLVTVEYEVEEPDAPRFVAAMEAMRDVRRRDGGFQWGLYQDTEDPRRWVETFTAASWVEHLRQHGRFTAADRAAENAARAFHRGTALPRVRHLVGPPADGRS